jgi:3a01208: antigen peptide transporter 2
MASISCQHIYKIYPGATAPSVTDFNLEIQDKEFIIFVGPSGCGKSTTLRMIAGLEEISKGEMYIGGRLINDVPPKDRDIAMVFQSYALYPHMTVYKNIAFGLELRKTPKDEIDRRVHEAAKILEIEHLLDRKPKALSGGQRQRVALGRAMVRNPASSCWTSLCPTWTLSCVPACAPRSSSCTRSWLPPSSTLPTTRPRL